MMIDVANSRNRQGRREFMGKLSVPAKFKERRHRGGAGVLRINVILLRGDVD